MRDQQLVNIYKSQCFTICKKLQVEKMGKKNILYTKALTTTTHTQIYVYFLGKNKTIKELNETNKEDVGSV